MRREKLPSFSIAIIGVLHRAVLFYTLYPYYKNLVLLNPDWLTWQILPIPLLRDNLLDSLWFLQQTPPLPNLAFGVIAKIFPAPWGIACALLVLQALISITTACMLYRLLRKMDVTVVFSWLVSIVFLLSSDIIFMEYNSFGQIFYENILMLLLVTLLHQYHAYLITDSNRHLLLMGGLCAMMALSRASFGYFVVIIILAIMIGPRPNLRKLALICLPVLVIQGGWALKTLYVYGYFTPAATSWAGSNLQSGMSKRGQGQALREFILENSGDYPDWFVTMVKEQEDVGWLFYAIEPYVPDEVKAEDTEINMKFPGNPWGNTVAQHEVSRLYNRAVANYITQHPVNFVVGVIPSYQLFLRPIREYTRIYINVLFTKSTLARVWRKMGFWGLLRGDYDFGNDYIMQSPHRIGLAAVTATSIPGNALAMPYLPWMWYLVNIFTIHFAGPALFIFFLYVRRWPLGFNWRMLVSAYLIYIYVAAISSMGEHGENTRFRLPVEPVMSFISVMVYVGWWRLLADRRRRKDLTYSIEDLNGRSQLRGW